MTTDGFPEFDPCDMCDHPEHDTDETCEQITGYGHLTGDQFCGCPGSLQRQLDAQRLIGVQMALETIRDANGPNAALRGGASRDGYEAGMNAAEELLEELETSLLSPLPNTGTIPETDTIPDPD
jgi:hypothetical protein